VENLINLKNDSIFKNKNFLLLWLGQLVSMIGNRMHSLAVMWYVLNVTGSATKAGITMVFTILPNVILSPITGPLADRLDRKKIIVITDLINGLLVGIIAILTFTNNLELWMLYSISALMSATTAFFSPAIQASIPAIVKKDNLVRANSLTQMTRNATSIFGPALAGVLITIIGIPGLFLLNSVSYLLSGFSESFISIPKIKRDITKKTTILQDFKDGIKYTVKNTDLLHIIIVGGVIINFLFAPFTIIIAVMSKDILGLDSSGYGLLLSALSVGALVMSFFIPKISEKVGNFKLMFLGLTLEGLLLIPFAFANNIYTAFISLVLLGASFGIVNVAIGSVIPVIVPNNIMGRVSSVLGILCSVSMPIGYYLGGVLLEKYSVFSILISVALLTAISGLTTVRVVRSDNRLMEAD
jgi:MFS family permease